MMLSELKKDNNLEQSGCYLFLFYESEDSIGSHIFINYVCIMTFSTFVFIAILKHLVLYIESNPI